MFTLTKKLLSVVRLAICANLIYFQYEDLNKMATSVQSCLARTREGLIEAINRLELQVMYTCICLRHYVTLY